MKTLRHLLEGSRQTIMASWHETVFRVYLADTVRFLKNEPDPFANPVGQTTSRSLEPLWDHLVTGSDRSDAMPFIDDLMRIRAIQRIEPSEALSFLFSLKQIVREQLGVHSLDRGLLEEILAFETRIDDLALSAFDSYLACRERLSEIRAMELRGRSERVLAELNRRLARKSDEAPSDPPDLEGDRIERGDTT
jgi:hypothetical protein